MQVLTIIVTQHQQERAKITDEVVAQFTNDKSSMQEHVNSLFRNLKVHEI